MKTRMGCRSGMTFIEVLIGMLIVCVNIASLVSLWSFSYNLAFESGAKGTAYNIGRRTMEKFKQAGFSGYKSLMGAASPLNACLYSPSTNTYVSTLYYDNTGGGESTTQVSSAFKVTATITADKFTSDTPRAVATDALITVDITVNQLSGTNPVTYRTGTYLVRSGV